MKNAAMSIIILSILMSSVAYADFVDGYASSFARVNGTINITGSLNASAAFNKTINASILGTTVSNITNTSASTGAFSLTLAAHVTAGDYFVNISNVGNASRAVSVRVTNITSAEINFTSEVPPFSNGTSFRINVSLVGRPTTAPSIAVYDTNGVFGSNWTITNLTLLTDVTVIQYNITIPGNADGTFIIVFERGLAVKAILVRTSLVMVGETQDSANNTRTTFGRSESVQLQGKIRDSSGPISGQTMTAFITLPNGTIRNTSLAEISTTNGTYRGTFTETSTEGFYTLLLSSTVSGRALSASTVFEVKTVEAKLDIVKDFFFEFGSSSSFQAGGPIAFNILVFNKSANDTVLDGSLTDAAGKVNCTSTRVTELRNARNGSLLANPGITNDLGNFFGQSVCKINFTAPSQNGLYLLKVNVSVGTGSMNTTATGYFSVQNYILKVTPVSSFGGGADFMTFIVPGDNGTFEVQVRNLSASGAAVAGNLIFNHTPTRIKSLNFLGSPEPDITNITVLERTNGTATTNPKFKILVPENKTGPFLLEAEAHAGGETITGDAFYFAKYVEGFLFPSSFFSSAGGGGGGGGGFSAEGDVSASVGEGGFGGSFFRCGGSQQFQANVKDVRTNQAARNVAFNSVQSAREEATGKDVTSFLTMTSSTLSDSNGQANITINISSANSWSGFYFFLVNVTTSDGKNDILFGGFECVSLNFFPNVQALNGTGFDVGPSAVLNVSVSSIQNINNNGSTVRNGSVSVQRIENFNPSSGHRTYEAISALTSLPLRNGSLSFLASTGNFSGLSGKWPNGFNMMRVRVCDNSTSPNVCDTRDGFFRVVAFDMFPAGGFSFNTYVPGQSASFLIRARTNITGVNATTNISTTGFTVEMGRPWEGYLVSASGVTALRTEDRWNSPANNSCFDCAEIWNVTFTVPSTVRKGFNMITITGRNYLNETAELMMGGNVAKFSVSVPDPEELRMSAFFIQGNASNATQVASVFGNYSIDLAALTNTTLGNVSSKSGLVCARSGFTVTRFGFASTDVTYNTTPTRLLMIDNATPFTYDTLVINRSGSIAFATLNNRSLASAGFNGLYLRSIDDCGFAMLLNATVPKTGFGSGWAGQQRINTPFFVPFSVTLGVTPVTGMNVSAFQILEQESSGERGGRGGFGFEGFLAASAFSSLNGTTDSNGVAFLRLNISRSGLFSLIWRIDNGTDTDTAEFFNGVPFEAKAFNTFIDMIQSHPRVVTLTRTAAGTLFNVSYSEPVFNGTWNESSQGDLVPDSTTKFHYIVLRNLTFTNNMYSVGNTRTNLLIDDDANHNQSDFFDMSPPASGNWSDGLMISGSSFEMFVAANRTVNENTTQIVIKSENRTYGFFITPSSNNTFANVNVTLQVCAETFTRPVTGIIGANITLFTQKYSSRAPPVRVNLTMYDPFTGAGAAVVQTGPAGCAAINVSHPAWTASGGASKPAGWTAGMPNEIRGTITRSDGTVENAFGPPVMVLCPPGASCFE